MLNSSLRALAVAGVLALFAVTPTLSTLRAADPSPTASPAASPSAPLDAADASALRAHVNEQVTIKGTITGSGAAKSGNVGYLNFAKAHAGVALVFFLRPGASGKVSSEDDLKPFIGKTVTVTGKLADYKGDLQIVLSSTSELHPVP